MSVYMHNMKLLREKVKILELEKQELIGEFLPHLDWALNELYPTHFNNEEYQDALRFYKKWEKKLK